MDIKPPRKKRALPHVAPAPVADAEAAVPGSADASVPHAIVKPRFWPLLVAAGALALLTACLTTVVWYNWALQPRSAEANKVRVVVKPGETATTIADTLYGHGLIRSRFAFSIYTQLTATRNQLQAGGYVFSPNQTVSSIVEHMVSGKTDEFNITILPGLTLEGLRKEFKADGFSDEEITRALNASYDHPLLASRPQGATLEGYIYPETYRMGADQSLEDLLKRSFDEMYTSLRDKKYLEEFSKRNLSIHQAVTLASIVQKEVKNPADQKQVAQVFLKRLADGMQLGSDVTFMYAAKQLGVEPTPSLDSPYNTRKYTGLPPGPIANMNPSALEAVAFPAPGDFVYFVAGDDGVTYFAHTEAEHNANVRAHCKTLCQ